MKQWVYGRIDNLWWYKAEGENDILTNCPRIDKNEEGWWCCKGRADRGVADWTGPYKTKEEAQAIALLL